MINLLPPEYKQRHRVKSLTYWVVFGYIVVIAALGLGAAVFATLNYTAQITINQDQATVDGLKAQRQKASDVSQKAGFVEDRVGNVTQFTESQNWAAVINQVAVSTPANVQLTNLTIEADAKQKTLFTITLTGLAADRRSIVLFEEKLAANPTFVTPTLQNVGQTAQDKKGYPFSLQMSYKYDSQK